MTTPSYPARPWAYHKGRFVTWELYRRTWWITVSLGSVEIQLNRWGKA